MTAEALAECMTDEDWFKGLTTNGQAHTTFEGFGTNEDPEKDSCLSGNSITQHWFKRRNATVTGEPPASPEPLEPLQIAKDFVQAVDRDMDGSINFSEYLLIRRAAIAWHECAQDSMNRSSLRCALSIVVHGTNVAQSEADSVFRVALSLMKVQKWAISFPLFILVADLFRTFRTFDVPADAGLVRRDEMLRHLAEQDRPHRITTESARVI